MSNSENFNTLRLNYHDFKSTYTTRTIDEVTKFPILLQLVELWNTHFNEQFSTLNQIKNLNFKPKNTH